jgi:trk system potassium uptake protein
MRFDAVQRILGVLLMIFSCTMLPPAVLAYLVADGAALAFLASFGLILGFGALLWLPVRGTRRELRTRDGFLIVVLFWTVLGTSGSLPFLLDQTIEMPVADAIFEAISGLTTTGSTVIVGIDHLPLSIRYYRQQLQWLGGMGIIVLAVAILPMLGVGGMQLYRAEMPGPIKDAKLTPRIAETAKALWYIYLSLTVACALAYWLAGMTPFDAITHSFSTVATGGFSTYDASIGHFDSHLINMICVVFMLISAINFALHFHAWRRRSANPYSSDPEFGFYGAVLALAFVLVVATLLLTGYYGGTTDTLSHGIFQVVSFSTTSGFATTDFAAWPSFLPVLLVFLSFMGGMANSTSGGIKVIRFLLLYKQGAREIVRLIHPQAQILVKLGNKAVNERVIDSIWGFFATYMLVYAIMLLTLMAMGLDQVTAFSAVAAALNNLGPGLGEVSAHFGDLGAGAKLLLALAMVMGRLEIFTLLVLLTPAFWRR